MENIKDVGANWKFHHVGAITRDMDAAVSYYESLKMFDFDAEFGGGAGRARLRMAGIGPARIELISPSDGPPLFKEFLDAKGEGIHHIAFTVDSLDDEIAKLTSRGITMISTMRRPDKSGIAFFDLRKYGGVVIELMQQPK